MTRAPAVSRDRAVPASGVLRCWTARAGFDGDGCEAFVHDGGEAA